MNTVILEAIHKRHVLSLSYSGIPRKVEPHAYGISRAGNPVLRCYQIAGGHVTPGHDWDLLEVSQIAALADTQEKFSGERSGYRRGDRGMTTIYAEL